MAANLPRDFVSIVAKISNITARIPLSAHIEKWAYSVNYQINGVSDHFLFCHEAGERFPQFFEYVAPSEVVKDVVRGWSAVGVFCSLIAFCPRPIR